MDWGSIAIGMGGLLLAGFTTFISYQQHKDDRKSKYRESLYSKQIEICQIIAEVSAEYLQLLRQILDNVSETIDRSEQVARANELQKRLGNAFSGNVIFVTNRMHKAFNAYVISSREALQYMEHNCVHDDTKKRNMMIQDFSAQIRISYNELIESMREIIGTEHFNKESLSIMKH